MRADLEGGVVGRGRHGGEGAVGHVQGVGLAVGGLQVQGGHGKVFQEQEVGFHQEALAPGIGQRDHRRRGQQAVGETIGHRVGHGRAGPRREGSVARQQLEGVADALEVHQVAVAHHAAVQAPLPQAAGEGPGQEEQRAQVVGLEVEPDLVVLAPEREQAALLPGALHHVGVGLEGNRGLLGHDHGNGGLHQRGRRGVGGEKDGRGGGYGQDNVLHRSSMGQT